MVKKYDNKKNQKININDLYFLYVGHDASCPTKAKG